MIMKHELPIKISKSKPGKCLIDMFTENRDIHNHNTGSTSHLHHGVTSARNDVRYSLSVLIDKTPNGVIQRVLTHSVDGFAFLDKSYALQKYANDGGSVFHCTLHKLFSIPYFSSVIY